MSTDTNSTLNTDPIGETGDGVPPRGSPASGEDVSSGIGGLEGARSFIWNSDTVRRLDEEVEWALTSNPAGPAEIAGVLLGKTGPPIEINDCHPVLVMQERDYAYALAGPGKREFERTIASFQSNPKSGLSVVGYYRGRRGEAAELTAEDLGLLRSCFGDAGQMILLINIADNQSRHVKLFSGDGAHVLSEFDSVADGSQLPGWLELWYRLSAGPERDAVPVSELVDTDASEDAPVLAMEKVSEEFVPVKEAPSRSRPLVLAGTLIIALLIGVLLFEGSVWLKQQAQATAAKAVAVQPSKNGLALRADKNGKDLRVDWDHSAPVLAGASAGILAIRDGNEREQKVTLNEELLKAGSVVYKPLHGSVSLRLVILGPGGGELGESVAKYPQQMSRARR